MAWGSFGNGKLGWLVVLPQNTRMGTNSYMNILKKALMPSLHQTGISVFMQDGATCHTSRRSMAWLAKQGVPVLSWTGQSPDQNPIENLWREWKRIIMTKFKPPKNLKELEGRMNLAWKLLSKRKDLLTNLCDSAQRRVEALLEADGGFTKY